jgi:DNA uptake protein ComE-like DNA-binding protein
MNKTLETRSEFMMTMNKKLTRGLTLTVTLTWMSLGAMHAQLGTPSGLLDPNTASEADLAKLPHFNDSMAQALVAKRPFLAMTQLNDHLKESRNADQLKDIYAKLFLHLNLNTASDTEIQMIPGVGRKMAHEFEEYRPYKSFTQFRKEIGKYVDEKEVARLQQYVFIPINLNTASDNDILSIPGMGRRMLREFKEYRPYTGMAQFRKEIGKYVDEKEVARLERYVVIE